MQLTVMFLLNAASLFCRLPKRNILIEEEKKRVTNEKNINIKYENIFTFQVELVSGFMRISANDFSAFIDDSYLTRYEAKYLFTRDPMAHKSIVGSNNVDQFNFPYF